jgi:hypothetical protein
MIEIQNIEFPKDCKVIKNEFYNYDPEKSYNKSDSLDYLSEDILQCSFPEDEMNIDLGWYGDLITNKGEFRIYMIKNENWEIPFNIIHSKSVGEITKMLNKILEYYTSSKAE